MLELWKDMPKAEEPAAPLPPMNEAKITWKKGPLISLALGIMLLGILCFSLGAMMGWWMRGSSYIKSWVALSESPSLEKILLQSAEVTEKSAMAAKAPPPTSTQDTHYLPEAKELDVLPGHPTHKYTLQLGIFVSQQHAEAFLQRLQSDGILCKLFQVKENDHIFFAVRSGVYHSYEAAKSAMKMFIEQQNISGAVIPLEDAEGSKP